MTSEQEIKTLQSLKGDTYFAQLFSSDDIDTMCSNITNDFAIELGMKLFENSAYVNEIRHTMSLLRVQYDNLNYENDKIIRSVLENDETDRAADMLKGIIGDKAVIIRKLQLGKSLTHEEAEFIIENLK